MIIKKAFISILLFFPAILLASTSIPYAQLQEKKIRVGIMIQPPFVIKDNDGTYRGLSIDLWNDLSKDLALPFEYKEYDHIINVLQALSLRQIDVVINPMAVSGQRIKQLEVSQPFFISSYGAATRRKHESHVIMFLNNIFSWDFFELIIALIAIVIAFGTIVWLVEKGNENKDFRHGMQGVLDGIWWSTVTITTVGYGDKTPKTTLGRVISMVWMFAAVSLISSFTATITSTLTVNRLDLNIKYLNDLKSFGKLGTVEDSNSEHYLFNHHITPNKLYHSPLEGLRALNDKEIDVFFFERPIIRYNLNEYKMQDELRLMDVHFNIQYFSFLFPKRSKLYNRVNSALADKITQDAWQKILKRYSLEEVK